MNMTTTDHNRCRLRCALCRRGLLVRYNVYDTGHLTDGAPTLYTTVSGYFYRKGSRHQSEVLEIAGQLADSSLYTCRLLTFDCPCKVGDLVDIGGSVYRIAAIIEVYGICFTLDLEVHPYGISRGY